MIKCTGEASPVCGMHSGKAAGIRVGLRPPGLGLGTAAGLPGVSGSCSVHLTPCVRVAWQQIQLPSQLVIIGPQIEVNK